MALKLCLESETEILRYNDVAKELSNWEGGQAGLLFYTASHGQSVVQVFSHSKDKAIYLNCSATEAIHGPLGWENSSLRIFSNKSEEQARLSFEDGDIDAFDDFLYFVTDSTVGFCLICRTVLLTREIPKML